MYNFCQSHTEARSILRVRPCSRWVFDGFFSRIIRLAYSLKTHRFENAVELKPNENTKYNFLGPNVVIEIKFKQKMANICLRMTYPLPHTFEHAPRVLKQLYLSYCNVDRQPETERFENDDIIS